MANDSFGSTDEEATSLYYQPGGQVPFAGIALMELFAVLGAIALGALNALGDRYLPSAILRGILPFGFGAGLGGMVLLGVKIGRVRNQIFARLGGALAALLGLYFSWVVYIRLILNVWGWGLQELYFGMKFLSVIGTWKFKGFAPTGWQLWAFWAAEALIVLVMSIYVAGLYRRPFCSLCNRWTEPSTLPPMFRAVDVEPLRETLEAGRFEVFEGLMEPPISSRNHFRVVLHKCPQCTDSNYLTVQHSLTTEVNGNDTTKNTAVIEFLHVSIETCRELEKLSPPVAENPFAELEHDIENSADDSNSAAPPGAE